jgi:hypothetical protein
MWQRKSRPEGRPLPASQTTYFIAMLAADSGSSSAKQRW